MPFINGRFYMNPAYGRAVEHARGTEAPSQSHDSIERTQPNGDGHWVTINHRHVLIDRDRGQTVSRPRKRMSLSARGLDFIKRHEGFRAKRYPDSVGHPTIGYGHLIKPGEDFGKQITSQQADDLLRQDVRRAEDEVNAALKVPVTQNQFDALVSFTYNEGSQNLRKSTLLTNLNAGKAVTSDSFVNYNRAGGKLVQGLTRRRTDEYNLFSKGIYGGL